MTRRLLLAGWLVVGVLAAGGGGRAAAAPPPDPATLGLGLDSLARPLRSPLRWRGQLADEAVWALAHADPEGDYLIDSFEAEQTVRDGDFQSGPVAAAAREIGSAYTRLVTEVDAIVVFCHDQWFDSEFALTRTRAGEERQRLLRIATVGDSSPRRVDVRVRRRELIAVFAELGRTTGERYLVKPPFEQRQISAVLRSVASTQVRAAMLALLPDAEWANSKGAWILQERPGAAQARRTAREVKERFKPHSNQDIRLQASLAAQLMGDLGSGQLAQLRRDGQLTLGWGDLSRTSQTLFLNLAQLTREGLTRGGGSGGTFPDLSRTAELGVTIRVMQTGKLRFSHFGRNARGERGVW